MESSRQTLPNEICMQSIAIVGRRAEAPGNPYEGGNTPLRPGNLSTKTIQCINYKRKRLLIAFPGCERTDWRNQRVKRKKWKISCLMTPQLVDKWMDSPRCSCNSRKIRRNSHQPITFSFGLKSFCWNAIVTLVDLNCAPECTALIIRRCGGSISGIEIVLFWS